MNKLIPIAVNDILIDEVGCSIMLTRACQRGERWRIVGGGCDNGVFWAVAEEIGPDVPLQNYRFACLCSPNKDEIAAAVNARYYAGFSTLAFFPAADDIWALFAETIQSQES